jgi:Tfp pilus assembly protein PilN
MRAVNLIPGEQRQGSGSLTGRSGGAALIVLGLVGGLAALILMYGSASHSISSQKGEVATLEAQASAIRARAGRLTPYTDFVSMADQRTQTVAQLVQARFDWSHALHELGRVLPAGTSLATLHGEVGPAGTSSSSSSSATSTSSSGTPASSTPPGSMPAFTLAGCAISQSVVAQTLQRLKLMDGANEVQLQSSTKPGNGSSGSSAGGGSCPGNDPSFAMQITFTGLPSGPLPRVGTGSATTAAAQSAGSSVQVATPGKSVAP